jgi:cytochrome oxidase Cu insertion factor (SCO1/SenC/PrrC family)
MLDESRNAYHHRGTAMRRNAATAILTGVCLLLLLGARPIGLAADSQGKGQIGYLMHAFSVPTYDGGTFTQENLPGKVTLIVFWYPT